jgi:hypothetical protein
MRQYALVPVIFIMVGCALLGSGWYMSKVPARIVPYEQYGSWKVILFYLENTHVYDVSECPSWHYLTLWKGYHEIRDVLLFTVPSPENMGLYDIENIVITFGEVTAYIYGVNEWHDFVIDIGKLKYPENYLTMEDVEKLKDFDMNLFAQFNTAERNLTDYRIRNIWADGWLTEVRGKMTGASYKFKYHGENLIGIGFVLTSDPDLQDLEVFVDGLGVQIEGRGLVKLYGYVAGENGMPLSNVRVSCDYGVVYTDKNGYYEINVPEGSVDLTYSENGYYDLKKTVNVPDVEDLRVDATLEKIPSLPSLTLDKLLRISGLAFIVIGVLSLIGLSIASRKERGMYWR